MSLQFPKHDLQASCSRQLVYMTLMLDMPPRKEIQSISHLQKLPQSDVIPCSLLQNEDYISENH